MRKPSGSGACAPHMESNCKRDTLCPQYLARKLREEGACGAVDAQAGVHLKRGVGASRIQCCASIRSHRKYFFAHVLRQLAKFLKSMEPQQLIVQWYSSCARSRTNSSTDDASSQILSHVGSYTTLSSFNKRIIGSRGKTVS